MSKSNNSTTLNEAEQPTSDKNFLEKYGIWIVIIYVIIIFLYQGLFYYKTEKLVLLNPNELGDFLAGCFAPLAFFLLYLGYMQQGRELQQNTKALTLQAYEFKNLVKEQEELRIIYLQEQSEKHFQVLPRIVISKKEATKYYIEEPDYDEDDKIVGTYKMPYIDIIFEITNEGELAKDITIKNINNNLLFMPRSIYHLNNQENLRFSTSIEGQDTEHIEKGLTINGTLELSYTNIYGRRYVHKLNYKISGGVNFDEESGEHEVYQSFDISLTNI